MACRMLEYKALLLRKYRLPVKQLVLYLGESPLRMKDGVETLDLSFRFALQNIRDYHLANLRNLRAEIIKEATMIETQIDIKQDILYKEGKQEGIQEVIINMLRLNTFTVAQIATFTNTTTAFVEQVQEGLKNSESSGES